MRVCENNLVKAIILFILFISSSFAASVKQEFLSPVTTDAAPVFWTGAAATIALLITEDAVSDPASANTSHRKPLGDASQIGDYYGQLYPNAIYTLGMLAHGMTTGKNLSYLRATHMFKATVYSVIVASALKYTVREPRPDNIQEKNSFPSGHTTTAFAFATAVAIHHEWYWGLSAITLASLTAYSRMNDGRHFLHDVVAGITIGSSYGLGIYFTQRGQGGRYAIAPILDGDKTGIRLVKTF